MKTIKLDTMYKIIIFFIIFFFIFHVLAYVFMEYENSYNLSSQKAQYKLTKNSIDVVVCGSSVIQCSMLNLELYHNTGIKTLLLASTSENLNVTYYKLKELYKNQSPKIAIIDLFLSEKENYYEREEGLLHYQFDIMKLNFNKILAINSSNIAFDYKIDLLFPTLCYHSNWKKIVKGQKNDNILSKTKTLLTENSMAISPKKYYIPNLENYYGEEYFFDSYYLEKQNQEEFYNSFVTNYLGKIIKLADKHNTKIIFTCLPKIGISSEVHFSEIHRFEILRKMYENYENIEFINLSLELENIDYMQDFSDECHLNYLGAQKVTEYFIHYLQQNYEFEKTDVDKKIWEESYIEYLEIMEKYVFPWGSTQIGDFKDVYVEYY